MCGKHAEYNVLINNFGDRLIYKKKFYILYSFTNTILPEYHDACGHFSQTHIQEMISEQLCWLKMNHNIQKYCRNCDMYQNFKSDTYKVAGLYAPLPVPY